MRKRKKFHTYFFVAALLLQCIAIVKKILDDDTEATITLNIYSSTFTLDKFLLLEYASVSYLILGLGYLILYKQKKIPNRTLAILHTAITIGCLVFYLIAVPFTGFLDIAAYEGYYEHNETLLMMMIPVVAIVQVIYVINIFIGIRTSYQSHRHRKKERHI